MKKYFAEYSNKWKRHGWDATSTLTEMRGVFEKIITEDSAILRHYFIESESLAAALPLWVKDFFGEMLAPFDSTGPETRLWIIHTCGPKATALLVSVPVNNATHRAIVVFGPEHNYLVESFSDYQSLSDEVKLVLSLGLYIHAFPHALRPGLPACAKHPAHYKGRDCKSLLIAPEVSDPRYPIGTHASPDGHWRKAHSRTFRHERYTKVRGQTIQVLAVWVGPGTPFTVEELKSH